jgi:hypothetical protein
MSIVWNKREDGQGQTWSNDAVEAQDKLPHSSRNHLTSEPKKTCSKMLSSTSNHHQFTSLEGNYMGEPRRSPKSSPLNETAIFFRSRPWRQKRNIGEMKENLKPRRDSNKLKKQHKHEPPNAET